MTAAYGTARQPARRAALAGAAALLGAAAWPGRGWAQTAAARSTTAAAPVPTPAPLALHAPLDPADMQADLALLAEVYGTLHPGLYRYQSPGQFAQRVQALHAWAGEPRPLSAWYLALARLTAAVRCGHSYPNPFNQRAPLRSALAAAMRPLPLRFAWIDGRAIVLGADGDQLAPGSELLAIDGVAMDALARELLPLARADGGNDAKRWSQLGLIGGERFAAFDLYRALLAGRELPARIALRVAWPSGAVRELELAPAVLPGAPPARFGWSVDIGADRIGHLRLPSWAVFQNTVAGRFDWQPWLEAAVDRLIDERARGLVLDLRGNEGGLDCGDPLLQRLIERPVQRPAAERRVRYRRVPPALDPVLDTWDNRFRDWGDRIAGEPVDGLYRLLDSGAGAAALEPRGRRFGGRVAVLIDAANSSATMNFAALIRRNELTSQIALVGATTGGSQRGINGNAYFFVRLPRSGVEVDLPLVGVYAAGDPPDAGIAPDVAAPLRVADIVAGRDAALIAATRWVSA